MHQVLCCYASSWLDLVYCREAVLISEFNLKICPLYTDLFLFHMVRFYVFTVQLITHMSIRMTRNFVPGMVLTYL